MKFLIYLILLASLGLGLFVFQRNRDIFRPLPVSEPLTTGTISESEKKPVTIVAQNLDTPWEIVFLPNGNILVTERKGSVSEINIKDGSKINTFNIGGVKEIGEGGLLGAELDPAFLINNFVYFYYTYSESAGETLNKVIRMKYDNGNFSDENTLVDKIPGASNHNGGRIKFGPDGFLYITTGDAGDPSEAQNTGSFAGKILRIVKGEAEIYSYGHRNPQGLIWDPDGQLWATEHGRSGALSGFDELNRIDQGKNYGWPDIEGDKTKEGMVTPVIHSGATNTWAPAGIAYLNGRLFWGGLRGQALYQGIIEGDKVNLKEHFKNEFGRIRAVTLGPDNMLYITTSNLDGRGVSKQNDDKIIRIDPSSF